MVLGAIRCRNLDAVSKLIRRTKMSKTMCCSVCKQDNISWRVWADELNNVNGSCEDKFVYCDNCEDETTAIFKENEDDD